VSDWRQIQARIRKARTSADPSGQLSALYERTHDAMVAFELAQMYEKAAATPDAVRWFTTAYERFRRPQWKQKAEEGLVRLGAPIPVALAAIAVSETIAEPATQLEPIIAEFSEEQPNETEEEMNEGHEESVFEQPQAGAAAPATTAAAEATETAEGGPERRRRRRGRRGGRGRHKGARAGVPASAAPAVPPAPPSMFDRVAESRTSTVVRPSASADRAESRAHEPEPARSYEPAASAPSSSGRVRSGDPALSSRMAQLESQLRRLLACSLHSLEQADEAPAGPGVFLITDNDQTTYYYAEACQTLRVGIGNMLRSGRGSREGSNLKEKLAGHLGINEARVGKYLKEHCGVRWLQLDEGAPLLAHFAVAVLRPISNE
jgi:hypothetical protein